MVFITLHELKTENDKEVEITINPNCIVGMQKDQQGRTNVVTVLGNSKGVYFRVTESIPEILRRIEMHERATGEWQHQIQQSFPEQLPSEQVQTNERKVKIRVKFSKVKDHWRCDAVDLPGMPPVGMGRSKYEAFGNLLLTLEDYDAPDTNWLDYLDLEIEEVAEEVIGE